MIESLHDTAIHIYIFLNDHNTQHYIFPNLGYGLVLEFSYETILQHTYILTHQDLFLAYMVDPQSLSPEFP